MSIAGVSALFKMIGTEIRLANSRMEMVVHCEREKPSVLTWSFSDFAVGDLAQRDDNFPVVRLD